MKDVLKREAPVAPFGIVALFLVVGFITIASVAHYYSRSFDLLQRWARDNGYTLVTHSRPWFNGPFFFTTGKGQEVFYVTVTDAEGQVRHAYVRVGGAFLGLWSDKVAVQWQD